MASSRSLKLLLLKIALAGLFGAGILVALLQGADVRGWLRIVFEAIREAGPLAFFAAMAVLPAFGCPITVFTLTAGAAFGLGVSAFGTAVAIAANVALSYWLARRALRPVIEKWVRRRGVRIPELLPEDAVEFSILVRLAPGMPFFIQSYLLGLAGVPFWTYLAVSWVVGTGYSIGFIVFSESLFSGRSGVALAGISLIIVALAAARILRRHYHAKKNARAGA